MYSNTGMKTTMNQNNVSTVKCHFKKENKIGDLADITVLFR